MYDLPVEAVSKIRTGGGHLNFFAATVMQTVLESGILQMITVFIGINHFDKSDMGQAVDKTDVKQAVLIGGTWGAAVSAADVLSVCHRAKEHPVVVERNAVHGYVIIPKIPAEVFSF